MSTGSRELEADPTSGTIRFLGAMLVLLIVAGVWDSLAAGQRVQMCIGGVSWLLLLAALWRGPREYRVPTIALVLVASGFECIGSLIWRAYEYRLHNLPAYVPPGHGLFYLAALRISALPALRRHGDAFVAMVGGASALWLMYALETGQRPDQLGALCWLLLIAFLGLGRDPLLFAVTCVLTVALEFYGTAMGTWCWAQVLPGTHLSAANPPAAIGGGYCVLDAIAAYLAWYSRPLVHLLNRAGQPSAISSRLGTAVPGRLVAMVAHPAPERARRGATSLPRASDTTAPRHRSSPPFGALALPSGK